MPIAFFYDTETTGLPDFGGPSSAVHQPHVVQIAAVAIDLETRKVLTELNRIVRPDGWTIPAEIAAIHGISTERAAAEGSPEEEVMEEFMTLWNSNLRIAHNEAFDARIVRIALARFAPGLMDSWANGKAFCTMQKATPLVKAPPTARMLKAGRTGYKSPSLTETYKHFFGKTFDGAHDALVDVKACVEVYWKLRHDSPDVPG